MSPLTHEPLIDALAPAAFTTFDLRETGAVQLSKYNPSEKPIATMRLVA